MTNKHKVDLFYMDPTSEEYLDLRTLVNRAIFVPVLGTVSKKNYEFGDRFKI